MGQKKSKRSASHSPLAAHKKKGSVLVPRLAELPIKPAFWERDWLPEYLWIASLREVAPVEHLYKPFYAFMDAVEEFWGSDRIPLGLLSDFKVLAPRETEFVTKHGSLVHDLFLQPFGRILAFFPESPTSWLVTEKFLNEGGHLDSERELSLLRALVVDLFDSRGQLATAVRMAVFGRLLKSKQMKFPQGMPLVELLPRYPDRCSQKERSLVESSARAALGAYFASQNAYESREWPRYFWRHNFDLASCKQHLVPLMGSRPISQVEFSNLEERAAKNASAARGYLDRLAKRLYYDLYEPERGEILHGLFSRCIRLYLLILENPPLWSRDTAGIFLRCLVESAITLCYLAQRGTEEDFKNFREYGEAQKKLLMLHLQDSHEGSRTLEGRSANDLSRELGGFSAELMQIELGHWSKRDARKLAKDAGLEEYYRLVFSPTSADIHGTWASLKDSNLAICTEPLHRFHRLPTYVEPPLYVNTLQAAQSVLLRVHSTVVVALSYPTDLTLEPLLPEAAASKSIDS